VERWMRSVSARRDARSSLAKVVLSEVLKVAGAPKLTLSADCRKLLLWVISAESLIRNPTAREQEQLSLAALHY
jgi:hypothetical protein